MRTNSTASVALGDIDNDGDLDLVCGNCYQQSNTLYLNDVGIFQFLPVWSSDSTNNTWSVALGDIDGDGDLDLVCGNSEQSNTLYLNDGGIFQSSPAWSSTLWDTHTRSVALGDIDGDGDLDLVCGNIDQSNTLYLNDGGILQSLPVWYSEPTNDTWNVILGDFDEDGDLDLVCGNNVAENTLYLNDGGMFQTAPIQSWGQESYTTSMALGDVNGDGYLDLICGTLSRGNTLHWNYGAGFEPSPSWISDPPTPTKGVVLGDIDCDGDLDLVCGNDYAPNALYLNDSGMYQSLPTWNSGPNYQTLCVVLGDIDGDGDLDLVCGNEYAKNTLYLNARSLFSPSPDWSSEANNFTLSVALGDIVLSDGYLDLVCGNVHANTFYMHSGGVFDTSPVWSSDPRTTTRSVVLGDIDNDGDLDLVCGNEVAHNTLYLNDGIALQTSPAWSPDSMYHTQSAVLGDVDRDGDLDLVCGNLLESNTLYLNDGGMFQSSPLWTSEPTNDTESTALGDIDGDGDLDLVCGNTDAGNTLYINLGGVFESSPAWSSEPIYITRSVALGDIDGDGDLDLVCGNMDQRNTCYLNDGGIFQPSPAWLSEPASHTYDVALADIDGDGDLDLVCGNASEQNNTIYLNDIGVFQPSPAWSSEPATSTQGVALADIDSDGDLDLVYGNNGYNTLYTGKGAPVFKGDPLSPTNHLPNNSAHLQMVNAEKFNQEYYRIYFTTVDVESDSVWLLPEYQYRGDPTWHLATIDGQTGKTGPFATSPAGVRDSIDWDTHLLLFDARKVVLRLRVIEIPKYIAVIQHIASYLKEIGHIEPYRPVISTSTSTLLFSTVTFGDTVSADLAIGNSGNDLLSVIGIDLPSSEMRLSRSVPFDLAPGERDTLTIFCEPRTELEITGVVRISSTDPLQPSVAIPVLTVIRALEVETELLTQAEEIPLGEAVTAIITPALDVHVERGFLLYRPGSGTGTFADSILLTRSKSGFVAIISGEAVTEADLEYYVRVENSGVFATDPRGAPGAFFTQAVEAPHSISSSPKPNTGSGYLEKLPIRVEVILPEGTVFDQGSLHYRTGGESNYQTLPLEYDGLDLVATIPDSAVGNRGVEYWVNVHTLNSTLTDPPISPSEFPKTIEITVPNLSEPVAYPGEVYRMVSIPLRFGVDFIGTLEDLLSDQPEFGPYDPIKWRSFRYLPQFSRYRELNEPGISGFFRPVPGRSFWLIAIDPNIIRTEPVVGYSTPMDSSYEVVLEPGWNMIGNPFNFPVAWDSIMVDTLTTAEADTIVESPIGWIIGSGYRYNVEILEPFQGYWVKNLHASDIVLRIPPREVQSGAPFEALEYLATPHDETVEEGWRIKVSASYRGTTDRSNFFGMMNEARNCWDRNDRSEPPMSPGRSISLYFPHHSWEKHPGIYSSDIRGTYEQINPEMLGPVPSYDRRVKFLHSDNIWGHLWYCDVAKNFSGERAGDEVLLEFGGLETVPANAVMCLIDRRLQKLIDLRTENSYRFFLGTKELVPHEEDARFVLIVGSEEFIGENEEELPKPPTTTSLYQNYPNPFNPSTVIRYDIAAAGMVALKIYDARGTLVKTLFQCHRDPGRYEIGWGGKNNIGLQISTGIYFYRLETSNGFTETRKMLLIR